MIRLPSRPTQRTLADWLEISLLGREDEPHRVSDTAITDVLSEAEIGDADELFGTITSQIETRMRYLGPNYPIKRQGLGFARKKLWRDHPVYSFLLLISLNQGYRELAFNEGSARTPAKLFETLTGIAIARYFGATHIRIGAPREGPVPATLPAAVRYAAEQLRENCTYGQLEVHNAGDDGVDIIGWLPFLDKRPNQFSILAQCAIGTDWRTKRDEISLNMWRDHIDFLAWPTKAFAVPFVITESDTWRETSRRAGIVFDRARIISLVPKKVLPEELLTEMTDWSAARIQSLADLAIED